MLVVKRMWFTAVIALAGTFFVVMAQDGLVEGSGMSEYEDPQPPKGIIHFRFERVPGNLTLQIEPVSAVNELFRGQVELTLWLHESWSDPRLAFSEIGGGDDKKVIILPVDDEISDTFRPETVVKSARYFKVPRSPIAHGKMVLYANGTVHSYLKVVLNLPCQSEYTLNTGTSRTMGPRKWVYRCTFRYGSYVRNSEALRLQWHPLAVLRQNIPCVTQGGRGSGDCELKTVTTFLQAQEFFGEVYDELIGHLRFQRLSKKA